MPRPNDYLSAYVWAKKKLYGHEKELEEKGYRKSGSLKFNSLLTIVNLLEREMRKENDLYGDENK